MVTLALFCYDLLLYLLDLVILTRFMEAAYGDFRKKPVVKWLLLLSIAPISCVILWRSPLGGTYPFFSVLFSLLLLPFYQKNIQKKLFFSCIQCAVSFYLPALTLALLRSLEIDLSYIGINYYILSGCIHLSFWILISLLKKFCNQGRHSTLPENLLAVVLSVPFASLIVLAYFIVRVNNNPQILFPLEIPLLCTFLFINITDAFIYDRFCYVLQKNREMLLLQQQLRLSEQHYKEIMKQQEKLQGIRHDMKNHLQTVLLMLKQEAPMDSAQAYIREILSDISKASHVISTGNLGIDAILSLKISEIKEKLIPLDSKITIPPGLALSYGDSVIILGNILDNAMDACQQNLSEKRWIRLEITYMAQAIFIRISNPSPPESKNEQKARPDPGLHGFGLKNVYSTVLHYHGTMDIDTENHIFTVRIVLYNTKPQPITPSPRVIP